MKNKTGFIYRALAVLSVLAMTWTFPAATAFSQTARTTPAIDAGTTIYVRTTQDIDTKDTGDRTYPGVIDRDVVGRNRNILIPKGSDVNLVVRQISDQEVGLDLESVMINGRRYTTETEEAVIKGERKEGLGANKRTATHVGGGAAVGAIIGAIAGGGKGAAIGAGAGAATGAGIQVLTRGKKVEVPSETLLTFRLTEPLRPATVDGRFSANRPYKTTGAQGEYSNVLQKPGSSTRSASTITIGPDKYVRWQGPESATVYVQVDNADPRFFASGAAGTQSATWMSSGHIYMFFLKDNNGNELARAQLDLR
jgi:hypothetical protein